MIEPLPNVEGMTREDYLWARAFAALEGVYPPKPAQPGRFPASAFVRAYEARYLPKRTK